MSKVSKKEQIAKLERIKEDQFLESDSLHALIKMYATSDLEVSNVVQSVGLIDLQVIVQTALLDAIDKYIAELEG